MKNRIFAGILILCMLSAAACSGDTGEYTTLPGRTADSGETEDESAAEKDTEKGTEKESDSEQEDTDSGTEDHVKEEVYWEDARREEGSYKDSYGQEVSYLYQIPKLCADTEGAEELNASIQKDYEEKIDEILNLVEKKEAVGITAITYETFEFDGLHSALISEYESFSGTWTYKGYYYDEKSEENLTVDGFLERFGWTEKEFLDASAEAALLAFETDIESMSSAQREAFGYDQIVENAKGFCTMETVIPYVTESGLYAQVPVASIAGSAWRYRLLRLDLEVGNLEDRPYAGSLDVERNSFSSAWTGTVNHTYIRETPVLSEEAEAKYPALKEALSAYGSDEDYLQIQAEMSAFGNRMTVAPDEYGILPLVRDESIMKVMRADSSVLSVLNRREYNWSEDGTEPEITVVYSGVTFDAKTGNTLTITDVIPDTEALMEAVREEISGLVPENERDEAIQTLKAQLTGENAAHCFYLDSEGMGFDISALGEIGEAEVPMIYLSFRDYAELFREEILKTTEDYVIPYLNSYRSGYDVDGDGTDESVYVRMEPVNDEGYWGLYQVSVDARTLDITYSDDPFIYIVAADGEYVLYLVTTMYGSGTPDIYVVDLEEMDQNEVRSFAVDINPVLESEYTSEENLYTSTYRFASFTNPNRFMGQIQVDGLGTIWGSRPYHVGENGYPKEDGRWYDMEQGEYHLVEMLEDLDCELIDVDGKTTGKTETLSEGSVFYIVRFEGTDWADVQVIEPDLIQEEGDEFFSRLTTEPENVQLDKAKPIYRIPVKELEDELHDQGKELYHLFGNLMYSG